PTLIASNPHIRELVASGQKLSKREEVNEYKRIVQTISPLVGDAGVSIEVFADQNTTAQEMVDQGREMFSWIANAYIKYPCTVQGLRAAQMSITQGSRSVLSHESYKAACLCISVRRAFGRYRSERNGRCKEHQADVLGQRWPCSRIGREHPQPRAPALLLCTRH